MSEREWTHVGRAVTVEMQTTATTDQLWLAWSDPQRIRQWFVDDASGACVVKEKVQWRFSDFDFLITYDVLEAVPERRLVLRAPSPDGKAPPRTLELDIEPVDGKAKLKLVDSGYPEGTEGDDVYESAVSGWQIATATLRLYLERFFGHDKRTRLVMRPTKAPYEKIMEYFSNPERVGTWIGELTQVAEARPYRLRLESGGELTGRYLAVTKREILLGADQLDGTLELKAFPKGDGRAVGLRALSWRLDDDQMTELAGVLLSALNRLSQELGDG